MVTETFWSHEIEGYAMPARRSGGKGRSRKKSGGGAGMGGLKEGLLSVIAIIVALGIVFGVLKANNVTDFDSLMDVLRGGGNVAAKRLNNVDYTHLVCNVLVDENCLFSNSSRAKIGDLNGDGVRNDDDVNEYRRQHGLLPQEETITMPGTNVTDPRQSGTDAQQTTGNDQQDKSQYDASLNALKVADPDNSKYSRADYPHWVTVSGACDTREMVLKNVGFNVDPKTCKALTGFSYTDPYTGHTFDDPKKLDIDHIIPLGYVNQHGGASWSKERKQQYANDISTVLLPVDARANRQKGDRGPSGWMPNDESYHCTYAKEWVSIASKYGISITQDDKTRLQAALNTCSVN